MKMLRILIVEDETMIALVLEGMIADIVSATVVIEASVASTMNILNETIDFAFLDIDVTNGKTFEFAKILGRKHVPFVFVSGSRQADLPFELQCAPFIAKPFVPAQIESALQVVVN